MPAFSMDSDDWKGSGFYTKDGSGSDVYYFTTNPTGGSNYTYIGPVGSSGGNGGAGGNAKAKAKAISISKSTVTNNITVIPPESPIEQTPALYSTPITMTVEDTRPAPNAPFVSGPAEINFLSGDMEDVTNKLPKIGTWGIGRLTPDDTILEVVASKTGITFARLYEKLIQMSSNLKDDNTSRLRLQVVRAMSSKSFTLGGSAGGSATGYLSNTGVGGIGGVLPGWGRGTVDYIYTIVIVKVQ